MVKYNLSEVIKANKSLGPATTVLFHNPISDRLVWVIANFTFLSPNQVTGVSLLLGFSSIFFIINEEFLISALLFQVSYIFDCVDGKLARLTGKKSFSGDILDHFGGDVLFAALSFFYFVTLNPQSPVNSLLILLPPFLIVFNNSLNFYFKFRLKGAKKKFSSISKSNLRNFVESRGIYFRIDNTDSIHFVYTFFPLLFYYNFYEYGYLSLAFGSILLVFSILIKLRINTKKLNKQ